MVFLDVLLLSVDLTLSFRLILEVRRKWKSEEVMSLRLYNIVYPGLLLLLFRMSVNVVNNRIENFGW